MLDPAEHAVPEGIPASLIPEAAIMRANTPLRPTAASEQGKPPISGELGSSRRSVTLRPLLTNPAPSTPERAVRADRPGHGTIQYSRYARPGLLILTRSHMRNLASVVGSGPVKYPR